MSEESQSPTHRRTLRKHFYCPWKHKHASGAKRRMRSEWAQGIAGKSLEYECPECHYKYRQGTWWDAEGNRAMAEFPIRYKLRDLPEGPGDQQS